MISALFYSWLVLLILIVVDTKGHIYWTSNEQFLCKRHLAQLKNDELTKLQEGVSCKLELQTGGPDQCRNRHKDTERKEGLWWTLPIPPMEVEGLLENKPAIKPGLVLAEKPQTSSAREAVVSSTTSAARRSSTTSLPNSSLQRSNVSPANAGPKGEARSSSTMKINAVTTLAELVSSSTALSAAVTPAKEKANAKIAQIQKPQAQPASTQHAHVHQHHQHQSAVNAYSQCSAPNKAANNAVSTGNKAITSLKSSASNGKTAPANKHVANKIKHKNHPRSPADQMSGSVLQHPHKRQVQACADSQTSVSNNIGNVSFKLTSAPKASENRKFATYKSSFIYRIKPKQRNRSDVKDQQLNQFQSRMNLKSNPSILGNKLFTSNQNESFPVISCIQKNKTDMQCLAPVLQVYKHHHPSSSELGFTSRFLELSSRTAELQTLAPNDEESTKASNDISKSYVVQSDQQQSSAGDENTSSHQESTSDSQSGAPEEAPNGEESQTSSPEIIPTHAHLKPYPGDRTHLTYSKNGPLKQNIHSNETGLSLGVQVSLKGISAASGQQISGLTENLETKLNPSSHSYKRKHQGLIMKKESTEKQDRSLFFHDEPLSIVKNFGKATHKLIMKSKEIKEPSSKQSGLELMTLVDPLKTGEKSFLLDNPNKPLLDHTCLPLLAANFIDHTILSDDNFLNNNESNEKNEEEEEEEEDYY